VEFELSKNVDIASQEIRDKISVKMRELPDDAESPIINKLDLNAQPIIWLSVSGERAIEEITKVADEQIRPMLQKIQGVGEVRLGGGREKEVHLLLRRKSLAAYNLGVGDVIQAVKAQHIEVPGGKIESQDKEFLIRTMGEFLTPEGFNELIVAYRGETPIRIKDLGRALSAREETSAVGRFTNKEGAQRTVGMGISPRSGANQVMIAHFVREMLPQIRAILPEGMHVSIATDNTRFIEDSINEIQFQLILGGIIAALVILVFLQNIRTTLISALAIPTSIIATFACLYWMGFTMNNMTLLALITAVGLVIDDAIVMVENIYRHRTTLGKGPFQAAFEGSHEIAFAVVATTLALAGVFLPVAFMAGLVGKFFFEFAITLAFAVACSTFVALTVVPMLCARFLTVSQKQNAAFSVFNRMMDAIANVYRPLIAWCLRHRLAVVGLGIVALVAGGLILGQLGMEFTTEDDQSKLIMRLETPLAYSVQKTDSVAKRLEAEMIKLPEVDHFLCIAGYDGSNKALMIVTLVQPEFRQKSQQQVQAELRALVKQMPDLRGGVSAASPLGAGSRNEAIQMVVQGRDLKGLDRYSQEIMKRMGDTPGFVGITCNLEIGKPEIRVRIDRERAADLGVSVQNIATAVAALLGGVKVTDYQEGGKRYEVRLRLTEQQRLLPEDISRIYVRAADGRLLDVSSIITVDTGVGPSVINRMDRSRAATIYANLDGMVLGDALPKVKALADEILPEGYTTMFVGRAEAFQETVGYIAFAFVLAIVLTYMVLAAQFESFLQPFSIMTGLPLSFIGAFGLLFILGNTFNLFSMIGLVLLVGLATKNGILLIDYTNQLRDKGMSVHDALVEAGATRLRPILMTAVSTIGGVIPVVLGMGVGSESRQPMAVAIAGGMISSTVLTLIVVPVIYSYLDQLANWRVFGGIKKRIMAERRNAATKGISLNSTGHKD
jgi:HAE1 family hydrophobic/amphiphilic exporter-1